MRKWLLIAGILALISLACQAVTGIPRETPLTPPPDPTATPQTQIPVQPGAENPDEPVLIRGEIPYTSPFFLNTISEPFVLLEDQAGFVSRDKEFTFQLSGQAIGPVTLNEDESLTYSLSLPAVPQATLQDLDNDEQAERGVQVFAIAYWSNIWGDPFLERRDGSGWSTAYASTITDPENEDEIRGGTLVVWAPDDNQAFPTGFGADGLLFTGDDPSAPIPAGYNIVDLDEEPFHVYKSAEVQIDLHEGEVAVNDFSEREYGEAFDALFDKASREYPFTSEKQIDWEALYQTYADRVAGADDANEFYTALRDFLQEIPDAHVGLSFNNEVFFEENGGGFGLVLAELSSGEVIISQILPGTPASEAGIEVGAELLAWGGDPIQDALNKVTPAFGPYSTPHHRRLEQLAFLNRAPTGTKIEMEYQNPDEEPASVTLQAITEYESLFTALPLFQEDELTLPIEGEVLDGYGLGYLRVSTFSDDYNLMAQLWDHYLSGLIDNQISGLIIDLRNNSGGSGSLALDFAGYFFETEIPLYNGYYYNETSGEFEASDLPARIQPGPSTFNGPIAVLVGPYCVSACEGFAFALSQSDQATIVGHYPTAGAFGEVGRGQYEMPEDISIQFPTGKPLTAGGELLIEGVGVVPDLVVPVTVETVLGDSDAVLDAAIQALVDELR